MSQYFNGHHCIVTLIKYFIVWYQYTYTPQWSWRVSSKNVLAHTCYQLRIWHIQWTWSTITSTPSITILYLLKTCGLFSRNLLKLAWSTISDSWVENYIASNTFFSFYLGILNEYFFRIFSNIFPRSKWAWSSYVIIEAFWV